MTQGNADAAGNAERSAESQAPADAGKPKSKPARPPKENKELDGVRLPLLVEFAYTVSAILVLLLALVIAGISFFHGASLFDLVLRTSVAVIVVGGLLMWLSSQISSGALKASLLEQEEAQQPATDAPQATDISAAPAVEPQKVNEA